MRFKANEKKELSSEIFESVFTKKQQEYIYNLELPIVIPLPRAGEFDCKEFRLTEDIWKIESGGKLHTFSFPDSRNNHLINKFLRHFIGKFIQFYSLRYSRYLLDTLNEFISKKLILTPENLRHELEAFANSTRHDNLNYYSLKRFFSIMVEDNFPGFELEELYSLDTIKRPKSSNWDIYYQLEVKLKPYENNMIRQGILKASFKRNKLILEELIDTCILAIFYATGARPVQVFNLKDNDIKSDAEGFYSIALPYAKQTSKKRGKISIKLPSETALLLLELVSRRDVNDECKQLLRMKNGQLTKRQDFFTRAINRQIYRFSSTDTRKLVDEGKVQLPKHTPYDYRHNIGHQMAMAGASAEEIAAILGHSTLVVARHYISATPELAFIKQRALGENPAYLEMMGMILTGEITNESRWSEKKVAGDIDNTMFIGIGGCTAHSCQFSPVRSCYSCTDFCPFSDAPHAEVLHSVKQEVRKQIAISDATGQVKRNPTIVEHEQTIFEIESVIARIQLDKTQ